MADAFTFTLTPKEGNIYTVGIFAVESEVPNGSLTSFRIIFDYDPSQITVDDTSVSYNSGFDFNIPGAHDTEEGTFTLGDAALTPITSFDAPLVELDVTVAAGVTSLTLGSGTAGLIGTQSIDPFTTELEVNSSPILTVPSYIELDEDTSSDEIAFEAIDLEGDTLSFWSSTTSHGRLLSNQDLQTFTYTPNENFNGTDSFTLFVSDGINQTEEQIVFKVNAINDAPTIRTPPLQRLNVGEALEYGVPAEDIDFDQLEVIGSTIPSWLTFYDYGFIQGTPTATDIGEHTLKLSVSDGNAITDYEYKIHVDDNPYSQVFNVIAENVTATTADLKFYLSPDVFGNVYNVETFDIQLKLGNIEVTNAFLNDALEGSWRYMPDGEDWNPEITFSAGASSNSLSAAGGIKGTQYDTDLPILTLQVSSATGFDSNEIDMRLFSINRNDLNPLPIRVNRLVDEPAEGTLKLAGAFVENATLELDVSKISDPDGISDLQYRWYSDGELILNADQKFLNLNDTEVNKSVSGSVLVTDNFGDETEIFTENHYNAKFMINQAGTSGGEGSAFVEFAVPFGDYRAKLQFSFTYDNGWNYDDTTARNEWVAADIDHYQLAERIVEYANLNVDVTNPDLIYQNFASSLNELDELALFAYVLNVNDDPTGSVLITGTAAEDQTLTATNDLADEDGLGAISYQWSADGIAITGATSETLTLTQSEVGKKIMVTASYTDQQGTEESATSPESDTVVDLYDNLSIIEGTLGDDLLNGTEAADTIYGFDGNDEIHALGGDDVLESGAGVNMLEAGLGNDTIILDGNGTYGSGLAALNISSSLQSGTEELINLNGKTRFEDVMDGGADIDTVELTNASDAFFLHDSFSGFHSYVTLTNDYEGRAGTARIENIENINAGDGDDILDLTSPDYSLAGQNITVNGGEGSDTLWGSDADETLNGDEGDDILFGGAGVNTLTGGLGADEFQFTKTSTDDTVADYDLSSGDQLKFFYEAGSQEADWSFSILNGDLRWGENTIDFGTMEVTALDELSIFVEEIGSGEASQIKFLPTLGDEMLRLDLYPALYEQDYYSKMITDLQFAEFNELATKIDADMNFLGGLNEVAAATGLDADGNGFTYSAGAVYNNTYNTVEISADISNFTIDGVEANPISLQALLETASAATGQVGGLFHSITLAANSVDYLTLQHSVNGLSLVYDNATNGMINELRLDGSFDNDLNKVIPVVNDLMNFDFNDPIALLGSPEFLDTAANLDSLATLTGVSILQKGVADPYLQLAATDTAVNVAYKDWDIVGTIEVSETWQPDPDAALSTLQNLLTSSINPDLSELALLFEGFGPLSLSILHDDAGKLAEGIIHDFGDLISSLYQEPGDEFIYGTTSDDSYRIDSNGLAAVVFKDRTFDEAQAVNLLETMGLAIPSSEEFVLV
jgi:hypothetical protein